MGPGQYDNVHELEQLGNEAEIEQYDSIGELEDLGNVAGLKLLLNIGALGARLRGEAGLGQNNIKQSTNAGHKLLESLGNYGKF